MFQLIYFSTSARRQNKKTISDILCVSRTRNHVDKLTGILIAGGNRYLQLLEGEEASVESAMRRISRDGRHIGLNVLVRQTIANPNFIGWSMAYYPDPDLHRYATFQEVVQKMCLSDNLELRNQADYLSRTFGKSPVRLILSVD